MKKENLILMIAAIAMLLGAILVIVLQNMFVPTSPIDQMFNQRVRLTAEVAVTDGPDTILTHQEILNRRNEKLGDLYTTSKTGFTDPSLEADNIDLYVAITSDDKVYVIDRAINQTAEYIPFLRNYILSNYRGISYQNVGNVDGAAGATTAFISRETIQTMIQDVVNYHFELVPRGDHPYKIWFGDSFTGVVAVSEDLSDIVLKKETINDNLGFVYTARANGEYNPGQSGYITLVLAIDADGVILGGDLPNDDNQYEHTPGFRNRALAYITDYLVGRNIDDLPDATGGATYTATLINQMISEISDVHAASLNEIEVWFGAGATVVETAIDLSDIVSKKETISNNKGFIYTGTLFGQYRDNGAEGEITLILAVDANGVILGGDLPEDLYGHTANRRVTLLNYINNELVGQNINNMPDVSTSNTLTKNVIDLIIEAIAGVHQ